MRPHRQAHPGGAAGRRRSNCVVGWLCRGTWRRPQRSGPPPAATTLRRRGWRLGGCGPKKPIGDFSQPPLHPFGHRRQSGSPSGVPLVADSARPVPRSKQGVQRRAGGAGITPSQGLAGPRWRRMRHPPKTADRRREQTRSRRRGGEPALLPRGSATQLRRTQGPDFGRQQRKKASSSTRCRPLAAQTPHGLQSFWPAEATVTRRPPANLARSAPPAMRLTAAVRQVPPDAGRAQRAWIVSRGSSSAAHQLSRAQAGRPRGLGD